MNAVALEINLNMARQVTDEHYYLILQHMLVHTKTLFVLIT